MFLVRRCQQVFLAEFLVAGAQQRNARLANAVYILLANGLDNRVVMAERRVRTLSNLYSPENG